MKLEDIRIQQDPKILIQAILDRAINSGATICIPIVMVTTVICDGDGTVKETQTQSLSMMEQLSGGLKLIASRMDEFQHDKVDELLDTNQILYSLKISKPTLLKYIHEGHLKAQLIGKSYRILQSELDRFLKEGKP